LKIAKIQIGTGELLLDKVPDPLEGTGEGDIGTTCSLVCPAREQGNKFAGDRDDERSRVTSFGEGAGVVLVREDRNLKRLQIASGKVLADESHKSGERTDSGVGSEATFENATNGIALEVQCAWVVDLIGGEHASESKE